MKRVEFRPPLPVKYEAEIADCGRTMGLRKPKSIKHNGRTLAEILEAHERFFRGKDGGARADLTGAELSRMDLSGANLPGADLSAANLRKADLRNTDMTEAILPGADLTEAQASGVEFF